MGFRDTDGGGRNVSSRLIGIRHEFETPHIGFSRVNTISGDSNNISAVLCFRLAPFCSIGLVVKLCVTVYISGLLSVL